MKQEIKGKGKTMTCSKPPQRPVAKLSTELRASVLLFWSDHDSLLTSTAPATKSFSVVINSSLIDRALGMHCHTVRF